MREGKHYRDLRRAMVAGMFYPANPAELTKQLADFFSHAKRLDLPGPVRALVVPHAGYIYSGQIAADAYKQIEGEVYETVVVVAPFHGFFKGASVYSGDAYETPLGVIEIDRKMADILSNNHPDVFSSTVGHTGSGGRGEHSLEVQLPFLQMILGKFKLVPIVMGDQEESTIRAVAEVLAAGLKGTNSLLVASTDMSHFYPDKEARRLDKAFEQALAKYDTNAVIDVVSNGRAEACGFGPVAATIEATKRIGGKEVKIVSYDTSGSTTGDFSEVVGYLSAVITGKKVEVKKDPALGMPIKRRLSAYDDKEKAYLHAIAREVVDAEAEGRKPEYLNSPSHRLADKRAVFVTINKRGMLRGCIGLVQARKPLIEAVKDMAYAAAFEDPRFPQVTADELKDLEFEISVLTPLVLVNDIKDIRVGRDGLMIKLDLHSGLLLPQVATEYGWDRIDLLEQTCLKAGLPKNSYQDTRTQIYKFTVEKF